MKQAFKQIVVSLLESQVKRLLKKNRIKVIGVVGSIGKTSTKLAIAKALSLGHSVRFQEGNYNDAVTVPLVFFGQENPASITNLTSWIKILLSNERQLLGKYPYEYVVLELGTDGPGQIKQFGRYLQLSYAVVTAITPEHMEFFENLNAVAEEELSVMTFAEKGLVNADLCEARYLSAFQSLIATYGANQDNDYKLAIDKAQKTFTISHNELELFNARYQILQMPKLYSTTAVVSLLDMMEFDQEAIESAGNTALALNTPGRLSLLEGVNDSLIIDDTYNASPEAVKFAIDILAQIEAPQKVAILGSMNELGSHSKEAHKEVGAYCNPEKIDTVVTIGEAANTDLAEAAEAQGCKVQRCSSPYEAGEYVRSILKEKTAVLAKGSQNGVFAEEAVKYLLKDKTDEARLVRQTPHWLDKKSRQFGKEH